MKILRKVIVLAAVAAVICCLSMTVFAADSTVTYHGTDKGFTFKPGSSYTDTDLFDHFKGAMPGDVLSETITVENRSNDSDYIKVYIKADIHDEDRNPLSPNVENSGETAASMTAFLSQLYMIVEHDGKLIYEASPDELGGFANPVYLGSIKAGQNVSIDVTLQVPITLGNEYADRAGEVDWVFHVEAFDHPTPPPPVKQQLTVRKVWSDDGIGRPEQVTVALLRSGEAVDSVVLNAQNQWVYTWSELDDSFVWTVEETDIPSGYTASYNTVGSTVTIVNEKEPIDIPVTKNVSVRKVWDDTGLIRPTEITADLLRNGVADRSVVLSEDNNWHYTWTGLSCGDIWTVAEHSVPAGYTVSYHTEGSETIITNTEIQEPPTPPVSYESLTVEKVWVDDGSIRPRSVEIVLLRNGDASETVTLNEDNNWRYTWNALAEDAIWTVEERNVPDGYVVSYQNAEGIVTVINTQISAEVPDEPLSLTVIKVWDDAHYPDAKRPDRVGMTLYHGEIAVETVWLGEWNHWTFTWTDLDSAGEWCVIENAVDGYTPYYSVSGETVTVTNTAILLQTGQLKWPIPVFAGCGLLLIGVGILLLSSKKDKYHAS